MRFFVWLVLTLGACAVVAAIVTVGAHLGG
jgi:hypothetical protein